AGTFEKVRAVRSDAGGVWSFRLVSGGRYRVQLKPGPRHWSFTAPNRGRSDRRDSDVSRAGITPVVVRRKGSRSRRFDVGLVTGRGRGSTPIDVILPPGYGPSPIIDTVWRDLDADGMRDPDEPGEPGVVVEMWRPNLAIKLKESVSDAAGEFRLMVPHIDRDVRVRVLLPPGAIYSPADQGDDAFDSDINATGPLAGYSNSLSLRGEDHETAGIGLSFPATASLGDYVWEDTDADGEQDFGEPPVVDSAVELWNTSRTQMLASTITDSIGFYSLNAPLGGTYVLRFAGSPTLTGFTTQDAVDDTLDSDPFTTGADKGWTGPVEVTPTTTGINTVDAGVVAAGP
nr:hypothetical protein [Thermoleophilaceae bacterium]